MRAKSKVTQSELNAKISSYRNNLKAGNLHAAGDELEALELAVAEMRHELEERFRLREGWRAVLAKFDEEAKAAK